jgi:hypothetical protein
MWNRSFFNSYPLETNEFPWEFVLSDEYSQWHSRALACIGSTDTTIILKATDALSWMYHDTYNLESLATALEDRNEEALKAKNEDQYLYGHGELKTFLEKYDLKSLDDSGQLTWPIIIASAGINTLAEGHLEFLYLQSKFEKDGMPLNKFKLMQYESLVYFLNAGIELIVYGESEQTRSQISPLPQDHKSKISKQNKQAAIKKHAATNALKSEYIDYYLNGTHHSQAQAATKFLRTLTGNKSKLLVTSNAERTLNDALRQHLKRHKSLQ